MKPIAKAAIATSAVVCATLFSFNWSEQRGASLSVESAQARVGRPLTPVSVAGVARRHDRRAYRYGTGTTTVGAGLLPSEGSGGLNAYSAGPYVGTGYYGGLGNPYYRPGVWGARAAYYGGAGNPYYRPGLGWGGVSSKDYDLYIKNLHDSGYDPKNNFNASGNVQTQ